MQRFFLPQAAIQPTRVLFPDEQAQQIARVLRLRVGAMVVVLDNQGDAFEVELTEVDRRAVVGRIVRRFAAPGEPALRLTLCQALLKAKKIETVWQKATELGATRLVAMTSERTLVDDPDELNPARLLRWEAIIREAAEQSHRARLPELAPPQSLPEALAAAQARGDLLLMPWEGERATPLRLPLQGRPSAVTLFIGPEGGFTPDEVMQATEYGARPVTLGPRILRAETAGMATIAAIMYAADEWV